MSQASTICRPVWYVNDSGELANGRLIRLDPDGSVVIEIDSSDSVVTFPPNRRERDWGTVMADAS